MKYLEIPKSYTGTVYVQMWSDPNSCVYGEMFITGYYNESSTNNVSILVGSLEVEIPLDQTSYVDKQLDQLRESKRQIIAEATEKVAQLDETIKNLLAIEYKDQNNE